ncbi:bile acid:sodium symporter/arsenical resistance protein Acr3 [Artemisia annua]|uniref:Bile acid:sodium symporter/arsenical resistance protein Acr3 n=1 Tax=Artemisia annua TaxID=35608 RepID=A0A2U1KCC2_ARTAN|nr:bile acid:sodium symporter/arsenical resistance protein Acr3 [Artemisia annua]
MSLAFYLNPITLHTKHHHHNPRIQTHFLKPKIPCIPIFQTKHSLPRPRILRAHEENSAVSVTEANSRWENVLSSLASLYPVYVTVGGVVACLKPSTFAWFVNKGPASYSYALGFIMLSMGLTLEFKDLVDLFMQRPLSIISCVK